MVNLIAKVQLAFGKSAQYLKELDIVQFSSHIMCHFITMLLLASFNFFLIDTKTFFSDFFLSFDSTGWSLYYLLSSIAGGELPWSSCNNEWNTEFCAKTCNDSLLYSNNTYQNFTIPCNLTRSPAKEYFKYDLDFRNQS